MMLHECFKLLPDTLGEQFAWIIRADTEHCRKGPVLIRQDKTELPPPYNVTTSYSYMLNPIFNGKLSLEDRTATDWVLIKIIARWDPIDSMVVTGAPNETRT